MKTTICDICKRTQSEVVRDGRGIKHFKVSWVSFFDVVNCKFDICDKCLGKISELMREEK